MNFGSFFSPETNEVSAAKVIVKSARLDISSVMRIVQLCADQQREGTAISRATYFCLELLIATNECFFFCESLGKWKASCKM